MSPLRGDYKKEGRKSGMGVGKHKEGCEITREKKRERGGITEGKD